MELAILDSADCQVSFFDRQCTRLRYCGLLFAVHSCCSSTTSCMHGAGTSAEDEQVPGWSRRSRRQSEGSPTQGYYQSWRRWFHVQRYGMLTDRSIDIGWLSVWLLWVTLMRTCIQEHTIFSSSRVWKKLMWMMRVVIIALSLVTTNSK